MIVDELIEALTHLTEDGMGEYSISVAYRWEGDTVLSNITSWCINGNTIQLNEEDFERLLFEEGIGKTNEKLRRV